MTPQPRHVLSMSFVASLFLTATAHAAFVGSGLYEYTIIADTRSAETAGWSLGSRLALNDQGMVSFQATRSSGFNNSDSRIYIGDGGALTTVAAASTTSGRGFSQPQLNNRGQVVFMDNRTGNAAVRVWENGSVVSTLVVNGQYPWPPAGGISDNLRWAQYQGFSSGNTLWIRNGGTNIVASGLVPGNGGEATISRDGSRAAVNWSTASEVGFSVLNAASQIRSFDLGPRSGILRTSVAVNNHGIAAVIAEPTGAATARSFVGAIDMRAAAPGLVTIADRAGTGLNFGSQPGGVAINNFNEISYLAGTSSGGRSHLYVSDVGARTPVEVLSAGGAVTADGATLRTFAAGFNQHALNDHGQIAFLAQLQVGTTVFDAIVRADPLPGVAPSNPVMPIPGQTTPGQTGWMFNPGRINANTGISQPPRFLPRSFTRFIDPEIAIGYDYAIDPNGPNFASVYIPAPLTNGDDRFQLEFNGLTFALLAGQYFDFTSVIADGVRSFRIAGINTAEGLDPANPLAFVTGLSFTEGGIDDFSMTMKPIIEGVVPGVPEPASGTLMALGLVAAWLTRSVQKRR